IDQFIEVYFGKYGNINAKDNFKLTLENYSAGGCTEIIDESIQYLENMDNFLKETDTELLNIRDEMIAVLQQTKYLLRLS
ncbi:hypothetical protein EBU91_05050, partial [bacterium]|nr:hypothetical protein [bacterium]